MQRLDVTARCVHGLERVELARAFTNNYSLTDEPLHLHNLQFLQDRGRWIDRQKFPSCIDAIDDFVEHPMEQVHQMP